MTFDDKFTRAYQHAVETAPTPEGLADRTIRAATLKDSRVETGRGPSPHPLRRGRTTHRLALGGACAAALALVLAVPLVLSAFDGLKALAPQNANGDAPGENAAVEVSPADSNTAAPKAPPLLPGLTLRAYAADGSPIAPPPWLPSGNPSWSKPYAESHSETVARFYPGGSSGSGADTMWPEPDGSITTALFGSETFTVEGSNIERVQIHISRGELFLQSIDQNVVGDDRVGEEGLDPRLRGSLEHYEDCDALGSYYWADQDADGSWYTRENVFRMKRMGSVIDLRKSEDDRVGTRDIQFGLLQLANTPQADNPHEMTENNFAETLEWPRQGIEGTVLTVTATFDDDTCRTQVIEIKQVDCVYDERVSSNEPVRLYEGEELTESEWVDRVTYGALVSETDDSFPYADQLANEYADDVMPPMPTDSQPYVVVE
ncbi:hypothetical protein PZH32_03070 [Adlercreutzia equolifaciens]|uniref:hypothetical protein n=1 Tax=Adlercreutzia equolifaciens TaxID=446660 RepID=UPI0023B15687|nr:hypothetical protein [Adlercreutzia equolifaciens]MDE8701938.1 hypothetical protein [Adlercreutzia equolifaciens]